MSRGPSLFAILLLLAAPAHARIAKIRWDAVTNALRYEIKILQGPEVIVTSVTAGDSPQWRGALSPGYFTYQIRAIDKSELAGEWTQPRLILVQPKGVQPYAPVQNALIRLTDKEGRLFLKWRTMGKRIRYVIDIKTETSKIQKTVFEKGEYEFEAPVSGQYQWRITPMIQADGCVDKGVLETYEATMRGETSAWFDFELELDASYLKAKKRFHAPILNEIPTKLPVPFGQSIEVTWNSVESAEAYEVRYTAVAKASPRGLSSDDKKVISAIVRSPEFSLPVQDGKRYEVSVRALSHLDKRGLASIVSPDAKMQFEVDDSAPPPNPRGFFFARTSVAPYTDSRVLPSQSYNGDITGGGVAIDLGARFYFVSWLETELSYFQEMQEVDGNNDVRSEQKIYARYVWNVGGLEQGLRIKAGLGIGRLSYTILSPSILSGVVSGTSRTSLSTIAVIPTVEVEQQLSSAISLGLELKAPVAIKVMGPSGITNGQAPVGSNLRAQATLRMNLGANFLVELFIGRERRGVSYSLNGVSGEESNLTATRGGLGINYQW